ncbi:MULTISPECIES: type I restriction-modification system subunit M/S [unclassified Streptomyces]|uniref:type I restriction-modification system subunit M/S n=1 Tax=unclassified Streptomyces TaxID=2593676 RepID=UPI000DDA821B|nr:MULTISPECIES: type I restriction-modification system subunit M/S [unclassified Streptomyces]QZZ28760.1 N-6 DNA methylase [Streptomyces sp. ST1015]
MVEVSDERDPLITRSEIASYAGVERPTVSNWARRHQDFPAPVRSGDVQYFRLTSVLRWLGDRKVPRAQLQADERFGVTYRSRVLSGWQARNGLVDPVSRAQSKEGNEEADKQRVSELMGPLSDRVRGSASMVDYLTLLLSLVFLRGSGARWSALQTAAAAGKGPEHTAALLHRIGDAADDELRRYGVLPGMRESLGRLEPRTYGDLVRAVRLAGELHRGAFRLMLDEYESRAGLRSGEFFTPKGVVRLAVELALDADEKSKSVYDGYARGGEMLAAAAEYVGARTPGFSVQGEAPGRDTLRFAGMHVALHGALPKLSSTVDAPWRAGTRTEPFADVVLMNPPFNMTDSTGSGRGEGVWEFGAPPRGNDNFAWLQYGMAHLRDEGRAVVVMPVKAGNSVNAAEREIRRNMIDNGAVECVIALPPNLFTATPVPVSLWVLRRTDQPISEVLLVDARHLGTRRGNRNVLEADDRQSILDVVGPWLFRQVRPAEDSGLEPYTALVPRGAFGAADYSLSPIDHVVGRRSEAGGSLDAVAASHQESVRLREVVDRADEAAVVLDRDWSGSRTAGHGEPPSACVETTLAELCEIQPGPSYTRLGKKERSGEGWVPVVLPRQLVDGRIAALDGERVSWKTAERLKRFSLLPRDIVCVRSGAMRPPAMATSEQEGWLLSPNVVRLRLREHSVAVDPEYLLDYLALPRCMEWMSNRAAATAAPSLSRDALGHLPVWLPPMEQQRRVVQAVNALRDQISAHREYAESLSRTRAELARFLMDGPLDTP